MQFPRYRSMNLNREAVVVPDSLDGDPLLLIAAFERWHQELVDSWVTVLDALEHARPGFRYYELPVVGERSWVFRWLLDHGMRSGIPSEIARRRTITVYESVEEFTTALEITDTHTIWLFLVDRNGRVVWVASGGYQTDTAAELRRALGRPIEGAT